MSLRVRRRVTILPGVHLNISRSGISTSIGVRGASVSIGKRGTYVNAGIPGTGISWRNKVQSRASSISQEQTDAATPDPPRLIHHLHWWKAMLFLATIVLAGATKSDGVIGAFWVGWIGYWLFLLVRRVVRKNPSS